MPNAVTGDSGGPLLCDGVQEGVVSALHTCGRNITPPNPVTYARVATYVQWIADTIQADSGLQDMRDIERMNASNHVHKNEGIAIAIIMYIMYCILKSCWIQ